MDGLRLFLDKIFRFQSVKIFFIKLFIIENGLYFHIVNSFCKKKIKRVKSLKSQNNWELRKRRMLDDGWNKMEGTYCNIVFYRVIWLKNNFT